MKRLFIAFISFLAGSLLFLYGENNGSFPIVSVTPRTIAIMDITALNDIPKSLAELVTSFVFDAAYHSGAGTYKVVARNLRDELLKEVEFSQSELSNSTTYLLQVGKHLSVQYLLTGNISNWEGKAYIMLQLVDVTTSEVVGSEVRQLDRDEIKQIDIYAAVQTVLNMKKISPLENSPSSLPQQTALVTTPQPEVKHATAEPFFKGSGEMNVNTQMMPGHEHQDKIVEMVPVAGGVFLMGSEKGKSNEKPVHEIKLADFYMSRYEITQALYLTFCQATNRNYYSPAKVSNDGLPIRYVSWFDACAFCNWLSLSEGLTPCYRIEGKNVSCNFEANGYRLPTEAEWEYAATGGQQTRTLGTGNSAQAIAVSGLTTFAGSEKADEVAWYQANAKNSAQPVGSKKPNALGLYDMSGNVWEWCWDWFAATYYANTNHLAPTGSARGSYRALRGGAWDSSQVLLRTTARGFAAPEDRYLYIGFRIVRKALLFLN